MLHRVDSDLLCDGAVSVETGGAAVSEASMLASRFGINTFDG